MLKPLVQKPIRLMLLLFLLIQEGRNVAASVLDYTTMSDSQDPSLHAIDIAMTQSADSETFTIPNALLVDKEQFEGHSVEPHVNYYSVIQYQGRRVFEFLSGPLVDAVIEKSCNTIRFPGGYRATAQGNIHRIPMWLPRAFVLGNFHFILSGEPLRAGCVVANDEEKQRAGKEIFSTAFWGTTQENGSQYFFSQHTTGRLSETITYDSKNALSFWRAMYSKGVVSWKSQPTTSNKLRL